MNILAIDSSTNFLRLALRFGGDRIVQNREAVEKSHGQIIIKRIDELIASAGLTTKDIEAIAVSVGPGSFTGLRIGLAAAKGMVMALGVPLVPVSTFEIALARLQGVDAIVNVIIPLNRDECIRCVIDPGDGRIGNPSIERYLNLHTLIGADAFAGVGLDIRKEIPDLSGRDFTDRIDYNGADLVYIASVKLQENSLGVDAASVEPLYLQKSQAEVRFERRNQGE